MKREKKNKKLKKEMFLKRVKVALIKYFIIFMLGVIYGRYVIAQSINLVNASELDLKYAVKIEKEADTKQIQVQEYNCNYKHETSCKIAKKGEELGLDENKIKIMIAISKWETARYTSLLYKNNNNIGGLYYNGAFLKYDNVDLGVNAFVNNLKFNYFDEGLDTIEKIQKKYCPIGAKNDPSGLNKNWLNGVRIMMEEE